MLSDPLVPVFFDHINSYIGPEERASQLAYNCAKRGVILLREKLAPIWGKRGARIVSLSPGIIDTAMARMEMEKEPMMSKMLEMSPVKRTGTPEELADVAEFLLSDKASFITGTDLRVDVGVTPVLANILRG